MNRNTNAGLSALPIVNHPRSKFNIPDRHKMTMNVGDLHCFWLKEVVPGDQFKTQDSKVIRLQTPIVPFMDDLYLDTYYFYVPNRLVWTKYKNFMGESEKAWYDDEAEYTIPQIKAPASTGWAIGTLADDLGIPTGIAEYETSALPFRAYALIWNEFFRSTSLMDPLYIPYGEATQTGVNTLVDYVTDYANGVIAKACKLPDIYTLATPAPQRGPQVELSLLNVTGNVYGNGKSLGITDGTTLAGITADGNIGLNPNSNLFNENVGTNKSYGTSLSYAVGVPTKDLLKTKMGDDFDPAATGLTAEINNTGLVSISELRSAFQIQKYFEALARSGDRYVEQVKALFGVSVGDFRVQRPEYLGGSRITLNCNQVVQTSGTDKAENGVATPQGHTAAYSLTADTHYAFEKGFVEHGMIMGLCVLRYAHTYQQGCPKFLLKKNKFDFYTPLLQSISEVGIKNAEIYAQGSSVVNPDTGKAYDDEIFGYQEAWYDMRYGTSITSGEMRSSSSISLDSWHFGDDYNSLPTLSPGWIEEEKANVNRALAVSSDVANQCFMDILVDSEAIRPMPVHSIPGNIDHYA